MPVVVHDSTSGSREREGSWPMAIVLTYKDMIIELQTVGGPVVFSWSPPAGQNPPGKTLVFSDNVRWQTVDGHNAAGTAGTQSGTNRIVRDANADPHGVEAQEHEATWVLDAVTAGGTHLERGQITVRGVLFRREVPPLSPEEAEQRFAITGGTGPYRHASGFLIEAGARTFDLKDVIVL